MKRINHETEHENCPGNDGAFSNGVMMALSAMAMGSTSAFAHGGHGMWQQNAAPWYVAAKCRAFDQRTTDSVAENP